jgi:hypothetical protein
MLSSRDQLRHRLNTTPHLTKSSFCPSLLCVRCQAGLLLPLNMEHRSDAKVKHRTQRLLADLPMSRHANYQRSTQKIPAPGVSSRADIRSDTHCFVALTTCSSSASCRCSLARGNSTSSLAFSRLNGSRPQWSHSRSTKAYNLSMLSSRDQLRHRLTTTPHLTKSSLCPSLLCVRCQAGLLPPINMEHRSDAKVKHRTQRLLADLPMSRHANHQDQHLPPT